MIDNFAKAKASDGLCGCLHPVADHDFPHYVDQLTAVTPRTRDDYHAMHRRYLRRLKLSSAEVLTLTAGAPKLDADRQTNPRETGANNSS